MSKKVEKSACPICGKKFVKKAVNQKYCSIKCKRVTKRQAEKAKKSSTLNKNSAKKKPVAKKITEKVTLPKPPVKKPDVIVLVHGNDPYKKFGLAIQIAIREFGNILAATQHPVAKITTKKAK